MGIDNEDFWSDQARTRPADRALCIGKCSLKNSGGTGEGLDLLIGL